MIKIYKREEEKMVQVGSATNAHLAINNLCARLGVQPHDLQIDVKRIGGDGTNAQIDIYFANDRKRTKAIGQLMIYS